MTNSIDFRFENPALLSQALTHPSASAESTAPLPDYQRLEYLGDAVLGLIAAEWLFAARPAWEEGALTRVRSHLANAETLASVAHRIGLPALLFLGKGEEKTGGREKPRILADALEAVLGALWLDGGHAAVMDAFTDWFAEDLADIDLIHPDFEPKGHLQGRLQAQRRPIPRYELRSAEGPDHRRLFHMAVYSGPDLLGEGSGRSKRAAETDAARTALHTHFPAS